MRTAETQVLTRTVNKEAQAIGGSGNPEEKYSHANWPMVMGFYLHDVIAKNLTHAPFTLNSSLTRHLSAQFLRQYLEFNPNLEINPESDITEPGVAEGSLFLDGVSRLQDKLQAVGNQVAEKLKARLPQGDYQHFYFPELAFTFNLGQKEQIDELLTRPDIQKIASNSEFPSVEDMVRSFLVDNHFTLTHEGAAYTAADLLSPDTLPPSLQPLRELLTSMSCFYHLTLTPDQQSRISLAAKHLLLELTSRSDIVVLSAKPGSPAAARLSDLNRIIQGSPENRFFGSQPLFDLNRPLQDLADLRDIVNGVLFTPDQDTDNRVVMTLVENKTQTLTAAVQDKQLHRLNFVPDAATQGQLRGYSHTLLSMFELAAALNRFNLPSTLPAKTYLPDFMNLSEVLSRTSNPDHRLQMLRVYYQEIKKIVDRQNLIFCKVFWPINDPSRWETDETGCRTLVNNPPDAVLIDRLDPQVSVFPLDSKVAAGIPEMLVRRLESELGRFFPNTVVLPQEPEYIPV